MSTPRRAMNAQQRKIGGWVLAMGSKPALPAAMILAAMCALPACAADSPRALAGLETLENPANAPVSIVAFSDYACPYSSQFYFQLEALEKKYPGRLRVMLRQLPLAIHEESPLAHEAALAAAAQGKLGAMSELLFANQNRLDRDSLLAYASQLKLNAAEFKTALDTHFYKPLVDEDLLEAQAMGIDSTPTIFLNGKRLDGLQTFEGLDRAIAAAVVKSGSAQPGAANLADADGRAVDPAILAAIAKSPAEARGPADAPVTIFEFSDFQCPFCRKSVKPLEDLLVERPNDVRLVFKSFPLNFHQYSELAHEAALAAGAQGKFWPMHDLLFANQGQLERADLLRYAGQLNLDLPAFERALDAHIYVGAIAADRALGNQLDVDGTPTLFINGKRLTGARSLVELEQLVDAEALAARGQGGRQLAAAPARAAHDTEFLVAGEKGGPIRVRWFSDVRSPLAGRAAALVRELVEAYPGQIRVDYKTMQLANHPDAELASRALLAAGEKFWPMFDALAKSESRLDRDAVSQIAVAAGLERAGFEAALDGAATTESIEKDEAEEMRRAVNGSPAIFIGDVRIDGIQSEHVYKAAISAALAAQRSAQAAVTGR